jgi:hypothetical protein
MAKQTFQGLMRTTNGRALSAYDKLLGRLRPMLVANPVSVVQLTLAAGSVTDLNIGMFPANVRVLGVEVISVGTSGTFNLSFPAYDGAGAVAFFSGAQNVNALAALTLTAADGFAPAVDRPIHLTTASLVGTPTIAIFCVGVDDARRGHQ